MAATGADAQKEGAQRAWRFGRSPSCLDQHGTGMRTPSLADATMLGNPETGLPHPRVQADIADQLLRTGEAAHIADCRHETGGDDQIDARDREQPLDRRIIISCLCDLRVENPQILAQPIELAQVPLDSGALVIGYELLRQPDPAQPSEQVSMTIGSRRVAFSRRLRPYRNDSGR